VRHHFGRVRSGATEEFIRCAWDDCDRYAQGQYLRVVEEGLKRLHYIFCSGRHLELWENSSRDNGNLPVGSKGLIS
jgi:hypothetical protein